MAQIILFFALYSTLAEFEEVVVLRASLADGGSRDLRLWVADRDGIPWVSMPRAKADANALTKTRAELLRGGVLSCVIATRDENRTQVGEVVRLRQEKYAIQRLAISVGAFGRAASENTVSLRLDPCPDS